MQENIYSLNSKEFKNRLIDYKILKNMIKNQVFLFVYFIMTEYNISFVKPIK